MDEHDIYSLRMVGCCASGTSAPAHMQDMKPGQVSEEEQWNHYNEFVFLRKSEYPQVSPGPRIIANNASPEYF